MAKCIYLSIFFCATCILSTHLHTQTNHHTHTHTHTYMSIGKRFWESCGDCVKISVKKGKISIFIHHVHVYQLHYKASSSIWPLPSYPFYTSRPTQVSAYKFPALYPSPTQEISAPCRFPCSTPRQLEKRQRRQNL